MTTALEGGEGSESRPGRSLPPGKTRYPLYRRLGGTQGRSEQVPKNSLPPGFDPRTVQLLASRYTDYATRPTAHNSGGELNSLNGRYIFFFSLLVLASTWLFSAISWIFLCEICCRSIITDSTEELKINCNTCLYIGKRKRTDVVVRNVSGRRSNITNEQ
jgi:hypothetical protein